MSRLTAYFLTGAAFAFLLTAVKLLTLHRVVETLEWRVVLAPLWVPFALFTVYDFGRISGFWATLAHRARRRWYRFWRPRRTVDLTGVEREIKQVFQPTPGMAVRTPFLGKGTSGAH
jgi:hypothetical protein